jgi:cytidine deaminase
MKVIQLGDLDKEASTAVEWAKKQLPMAYAPYSRFPVSCVLVLGGGDFVTGVNVENASYSLSICAERVAVFQAVKEGHRDFRFLVIATTMDDPATPCGACRQVLSEFAKDLRLLLVGREKILECQLEELLPHAFGDWRQGEGL